MASVPRNRGANTTIIASITLAGRQRAQRGGRPRIRVLVEGAGCDLWYLPAYSPDPGTPWAPIEEAFSGLRAALRKAAARAKGALLEAIAEALAATTTSDAAGYFAHCGYEPPGHDMSRAL